MKAGAGLWIAILALGTLGLLHCERQAAPPVQPAQDAAPARPLEPWRWHFVGGLMVVEGELDQPAELTLKGRFVSESCQAPLGPVRWEIYRPPAGEVVELRSGEGKLLAKWDLDAPPPMLPAPPPPASVVKVQMPKPAPAPPPVPAVAVQAPKPVPAPPPAPVIELPYGPWARTEPHLPLPRPVQAPPPVRVPPPAVAVQAPKPVPAPPPAPVIELPYGPWARTEPHLPLPRPVQAPPPVRVPPPAVAVQAPKPAPAPPPAPVVKLPYGPWARTEPHLPLPRPVQAPPPVRVPPPAPAVAVQAPRPAPAPPPAPVVKLPYGPWARTEPHLPLPRPVQAPPPVRVPPPAPTVAVQAPRPAPAPPPAPAVKLPYGPWARTEPHLPLPRPVQAPPPVRVPPPAPAFAVQAPRPAPAPPPAPAVKLPYGPWARTESHLPLPRPVQAPPPVRVPPPAPTVAVQAPRPAPAPLPAPAVKLPYGPWARTEPHLPLPRPVQAPPPVRVPPPLPAVAVQAPRPAPAPPPAPVVKLPYGPWARTEPHLPLPRPVQAPPPVRVPPPLPAVAVQAPRPAPAPPPAPVVKLPYGPWARTEPHLPLPRPVQAPPPVRVPPPAPAVAVQAPRPASAPPPPVAKTQEASLIPRPVPAPRPLPSLPPAIPPGDAGRTAPVPLSPQAAATVAQDWPGAGEGLNLLRGPKGERRICMTFDGGSTAEVAVDVLDALHDHGIRTTIFLTGDFIKKYPDLVLRMIKEGHELGNHTMTHPHMAPRMKRDPRWTKELIQKELLDADRAFYRLTGRPMDPYWRSPFGENTAEIRKWAEELGYRHVDWSEGADTLDWATVKEYNLYRNGTATIERLERRMKKSDGDGLIVLMHLGSLRPAFDRPAKYLGPFMDRAIKDGWHFVCIGEYLKSMGKPRWDPSRRLAWIRQGSD